MTFHMLGMALNAKNKKKADEIAAELNAWRTDFSASLADVTGNIGQVVFMPSSKEAANINFFLDTTQEDSFALDIVKRLLKLHPMRYLKMLDDVETAVRDFEGGKVKQISIGMKPTSPLVPMAIEQMGVEDMFPPTLKRK